MRIRAMTPEDWPAVRDIYAEGIASGNATFESEPPRWLDFTEHKLTLGRLVAESETGVVGWVAASATSSRSAYRGVIEHSVYVTAAARGQGVGGRLLDEFLAQADAGGAWTVQCSIFPENVASLALHASHGFRTVGHRERIGLMTYGPWRGQWRDTMLIERRRR